MLGGNYDLEADSLVLAAAVVPSDYNKELAKMFKVSDERGRILPGSPHEVETSGLRNGRRLSWRVWPIIPSRWMKPSHRLRLPARTLPRSWPGATWTRQEWFLLSTSYLCRGCGRCVDVCPFHAPELKEIAPGVVISEVNPALCKGCGACGVACPTGAASNSPLQGRANRRYDRRGNGLIL